jgi:hypothetical protein
MLKTILLKTILLKLLYNIFWRLSRKLCRANGDVHFYAARGRLDCDQRIAGLKRAGRG